MSLVSLPSIAEQQFAAYLSANLSTDYQKQTPEGTVTAQYEVVRAFSIGDYTLPLIIVHAGRFTELEPGTHVYEGTLSVSVTTQIDDTIEDAVAVHDSTVAKVYDVLADSATVASGVAGANFHLWSFVNAGYEQRLGEADNKRALDSILEFRISAQTLAVS